MAESGLLVTVSGAALSLLLYENVRSFGDQMGFLLGDVVVFVTKKVTDSDRQVEHKKTHIDVNTVITCPHVNWLYNGVGRVDKKRLKQFVRDEGKHVVGWFRFRQNGSLTPTLRDKVLHKEFSSYFCNSTDKEESFAMCILNTSVSEMGGTHKFRHVFLRYKQGYAHLRVSEENFTICIGTPCVYKIFEPIPLRINNLGDDASRHDGSDYRPTPTKKLSEENDAFSKIIKTLNLDLVRTPGVELVTSIQKAAEIHLDDLIPLVSDSDREVAELEKQVRDLQIKVLDRKIANTSRESEPSWLTNRKSQKKKDVNERPKKMEESKISADNLSRELVDIFSEEAQAVRSQTTTAGQIQYSNKQRNLVIQPQKSVNVKPKNVNQERARSMEKELNTSIANSSGSQDPFANIVTELKMGMTENSSNKTTRHSISNMDPGLGRLSSNEAAVGRGFGRGHGTYTATQESNSGFKKARRGVVRPKNVSDRHSLDNPPQENKSPSLISTQDIPALSVSYSQATRKNADSNPANTADTNSQEY